jgi:transcriptional regulator with XRE-family HTH domain
MGFPPLDERTIVTNIKELRVSSKTTLERLAKITGLTKGYLSRIENSTKAPPISTLAKISKALGVDITQFFAEKTAPREARDISIIKRNETLEVGRKGAPYGYIYEALAYRMPGKNMEPYAITVNDEASSVGFRHEGEEFIHMLEGKLEFIYDGKKYLLEKGDSAYFDSGKMHTGKSVGEKKARFLCIIYSYRRI